MSARLSGETARVVVAAYPELPVAERGHGRAWMPGAVLHDRVARATQPSPPAALRRRPPPRPLLRHRDAHRADDRPRPRAAGDRHRRGHDRRRRSSTARRPASTSPPSAGRPPTPEPPSGAGDDRDPPLRRRRPRGRPATRAAARSPATCSTSGRCPSTTASCASRAPPCPLGGRRRRRPTSESFVTALELEDDRLVEVGRVGGLGRDEQIYAVRFIGDLGYVVTFRQVDPLYVLDLSRPARAAQARRAQDPRLLRLPAPGRRGPAARRRPGRDRATDRRPACRCRCSTSPIRRRRCGSTASGSAATPTRRSSTTTMPSPTRPTSGSPCCRSSPGSSREFYGAVGVRVDPVSGLERTAQTSQGDEL